MGTVVIGQVCEDDPTVTFPAPNPAEIENELGADETIATTIDQL